LQEDLMHPDLERLLDLQEKDLALLQVDTRLKALLDDLAGFDGEIARAETELTDTRRNLHSAVKRREEIEAKVEGLRVLQDRRRQRLELAKTPRELSALTNELELSRSVLAKEEAEWFRAMEATTGLEARAGELAGRIEELRAAQAGPREELAVQIAEVQAERELAQVARTASAVALAKPLLMRYDRLRSNRRNDVVVALRGDACGACFTAVPMSRRSHIRAGLLLDGCEACGVILYSAGASDEEA
jgi:hypothetical protein